MGKKAKKEEPFVQEIFGKEAMVDAIYDELKALEGEEVPASLKTVTKKAIGAILDFEQSLIKDAVADGHKVRYIGFGSYEKRFFRARKGRNPQTGAELSIPAKELPGFTPGKDFKDKVAK